MPSKIFIYLATLGWVLTILLLLIYVWKYELGLNLIVPLPNIVIRNNQVHNLENENTKENSTSSCYNNETKEETRIAENV
jgi:hypothetical protein